MRWQTADDGPAGCSPSATCSPTSTAPGGCRTSSSCPSLAHRCSTTCRTRPARTGRSTPIAAAAMRAYTASPGRPTSISASTRAATSTRRSSSRSMRWTCCGGNSRIRAGRARRSRWARTPIPTNAPRRSSSSPAASSRALVEADTPFTILTKSPLVTRDLDLIAPAAQHLEVSVSFSIATIDEHAWRLSEPGTPHPLRRVEAIRAMVDAGVPTGVMMAPILPGPVRPSRRRSRRPRARSRTPAPRCTHAHPVYLRGATREHFMSWLHDARPRPARALRPRLHERGDVSREYKTWVSDAVAQAKAQHR